MHILVVTCGILIALGLEGIREAAHSRHLVRETRENIHFEMSTNLENSHDELQRVKQGERAMEQMVAEFRTTTDADPEAMERRLAAAANPNYFFTATSWQAALSTGVLGQIRPDEVIRYAGAAEIIGIYSKLQNEEKTQENKTRAFLAAHSKMSGAERAEATERLVLLYRAEETLTYVGPQMRQGIERALETAR